MEPSMADQVLVELYGAVAASRREESYLSLESIGAVIAEALDERERRLLAHILTVYEQEPTASEYRA